MRINNIFTDDMTLSNAQEIISKSGKNLQIFVKGYNVIVIGKHLCFSKRISAHSAVSFQKYVFAVLTLFSLTHNDVAFIDVRIYFVFLAPLSDSFQINFQFQFIEQCSNFFVSANNNILVLLQRGWL